MGERIGLAARPGMIIAFRGGLGAGKTTLTKGIARGLTVESPITSPTYTLVHEHQGRLPLYHVDAYRLSSGRDFEDIGGLDFLYSDGLCVIEWSENIMDVLPSSTIWIEITDGEAPDSRVFRISGPLLEESLS